MNKVIGVGRVVGGRIVYTGEHGGFVRPVVRKEAVVVPAVEEVSIVFNFKSKPVQKAQVVKVDFVQEDRVNAAIDRTLGVVVPPMVEIVERVASKMVSPFRRFFMDGEDVKDIVRRNA